MNPIPLFSDLVGKTIRSVRYNSTEFAIWTDAEVFCLHHDQDCCEEVKIDRIEGNEENLIHETVLFAEEDSKGENIDWGHKTITTFTIRTAKGEMKIVWIGESNGYYSEEVHLKVLKIEKA